MPHTWVGSDFINAARALFVYEDEWEHSLVIGAGLYREWIDAPEGMAVSHLPTYYGDLSYEIQPTQSGYRVKIDGDLRIPEGKIKLKLFRENLSKEIKINGRRTDTFTIDFVRISVLPAVVEIYY